MPLLELIPFGVTDPGRVRENNEDAMLVGEGRDETLFAVADGIGGFEAGEVASSIAVDVLSELEPGSAFETAVAEANRRILASGRGDDRLSGMGTTIVAVRFGGSQERPTAEVAHVGDSRAYLLRGGELKPVTEDHSLVAELVRSGDLTRAQAAEHPQKNLITRALGAEEKVEVDTTVLPVETGDRFLLCSDGLTDMVPEDRVAEILSEHPDDPEGTARSLLSAALEAGGNDNITTLIVDLKEYVPPAPARDDRREARSGTSEMPAVGASEGPADGSSGGTGNVSPRSRSTSRRPTSADAKRQSGRPKSARPKAGRLERRRKTIGRLVRGFTAILILAAALTPAYLWASSRYFFEFQDGEVVAYRGLPYAPLGYELNTEWRRTGLRESEIKEPYEEPVENHKLYTEDQAQKVLGDLGR